MLATKPGGCTAQEIEHERDLCCDIEIRENKQRELASGMQILYIQVQLQRNPRDVGT